MHGLEEEVLWRREAISGRDRHGCLEDPRLGQTDLDPGPSHAAFHPWRRQPRLKHALQRRFDGFAVTLLQITSDLPAADRRRGHDAHGNLLVIDDQANRRPVAQPFPARSHRAGSFIAGGLVERETKAGDQVAPNSFWSHVCRYRRGRCGAQTTHRPGPAGDCQLPVLIELLIGLMSGIVWIPEFTES